MQHFQKRINKVQTYLKKSELDLAIFKDPANIFYLSNFYGAFSGAVGYLFVPARGKTVLLTDFRYIEEADRNCLATIETRKIRNKVFEEVGEIVGSKDFVGGKSKDARMGFEGSKVSWREAASISEVINGATLVDISELVGTHRAVKDAKELEIIRYGQKLADKALKKFLKRVRPGLTERHLAAELENIIKSDLAAEPSFDIIMASGPNSSMPHARVTDRKLKRSDLLKIDFGIRYKGYCTDMTRTVAIGKATNKSKAIYQKVLEAQTAALAAIKAGQKCQFIDKIARDIIVSAGYPDNFGHNLGHGTGIDVHETPTLGPRSDDTLKENMVITVEPGIYLPGTGGVRIEDLVVVKKGGIENLTKYPKELILI